MLQYKSACSVVITDSQAVEVFTVEFDVPADAPLAADTSKSTVNTFNASKSTMSSEQADLMQHVDPLKSGSKGMTC